MRAAPPRPAAVPTPRLPREELVEQAYFFRALRERAADGWSTQQALAALQEELLATTRMPLAAGSLLDCLGRGGELSEGFARLPHYFTPFQTHVVRRSEADKSRFTFGQALLALEREAAYKADPAATPAGLFVYQLEAVARNQLGYLDGLIAMEGDGWYDDEWRGFCRWCRAMLGERDVAELIHARSVRAVQERQADEPGYVPPRPPLFGEKEGRIAGANRGRDPNHLFAALQRQLGYPEVPRPPRVSDERQKIDELTRRLKALEEKHKILEGEVFGRSDPGLFVAKPT